MLHQVKLFLDDDMVNPMKHWVQAMEDGLVHVDAVSKYGDTLGVVFVCAAVPYWQKKYWLRYWALKPSASNFWILLQKLENEYSHLMKAGDFQETVLPRMADIPALWEDLTFLYNLVAMHSPSLAWLLPELDRRVSVSLRLAWIAAVAR